MSVWEYMGKAFAKAKPVAKEAARLPDMFDSDLARNLAGKDRTGFHAPASLGAEKAAEMFNARHGKFGGMESVADPAPAIDPLVARLTKNFALPLAAAGGALAAGANHDQAEAAKLPKLGLKNLEAELAPKLNFPRRGKVEWEKPGHYNEPLYDHFGFGDELKVGSEIPRASPQDIEKRAFNLFSNANGDVAKAHQMTLDNIQEAKAFGYHPDLLAQEQRVADRLKSPDYLKPNLTEVGPGAKNGNRFLNALPLAAGLGAGAAVAGAPSDSDASPADWLRRSLLGANDRGILNRLGGGMNPLVEPQTLPRMDRLDFNAPDNVGPQTYLRNFSHEEILPTRLHQGYGATRGDFMFTDKTSNDAIPHEFGRDGDTLFGLDQSGGLKPFSPDQAAYEKARLEQKAPPMSASDIKHFGLENYDPRTGFPLTPEEEAYVRSKKEQKATTPAEKASSRWNVDNPIIKSLPPAALAAGLLGAGANNDQANAGPFGWGDRLIDKSVAKEAGRLGVHSRAPMGAKFDIQDPYGRGGRTLTKEVVATSPDGNPLGHITFQDYSGYPVAGEKPHMEISLSHTDPVARGRGVGGGMYQALADYAASKDVPLLSDSSVSAFAAKAYQRLKDAGYSVARLPSKAEKVTYPRTMMGYHADNQSGSVFAVGAKGQDEYSLMNSAIPGGIGRGQYGLLKAGRTVKQAREDIAPILGKGMLGASVGAGVLWPNDAQGGNTGIATDPYADDRLQRPPPHELLDASTYPQRAGGYSPALPRAEYGPKVSAIPWNSSVNAGPSAQDQFGAVAGPAMGAVAKALLGGSLFANGSDIADAARAVPAWLQSRQAHPAEVYGDIAEAAMLDNPLTDALSAMFSAGRTGKDYRENTTPGNELALIKQRAAKPIPAIQDRYVDPSDPYGVSSMLRDANQDQREAPSLSLQTLLSQLFGEDAGQVGRRIKAKDSARSH